MTEVVITDLESGLRSLFHRAYLANLEFEGTELSEEDLETLEDLNALEVLENFKDLVETLLACKRDFKLSDKSEIAGRCEQFESMLQKLESEVRNHIRVEQQLKLHSDTLQAKLDEMEKEGAPEAVKSRGEHLRRQSMSTIGLAKNDKVEMSHRRVSSMERESAELKGDSKAQRLIDTAEQKHRAITRLEKECASVRFELDKRMLELDRLRQEYDQIIRELSLYKVKKSQEAAAKANRSERPLTDRSIRKSSDLKDGRCSDNGSRAKTEITPEANKKQQQTSSTSEKAKRPVTSTRPRSNV